MKVHELKIKPEYFEEKLNGSKSFEIRFNDRNFQKGDILHLREWHSNGIIGGYTGRSVHEIVMYVLSDVEHEYLKDGFVCMGTRILKDFNG